MPLSTSNSDAVQKRAGLDRFTIVILITVFLTMVFCEVLTRVGFDRTSKVQRKELSQRRALLTVDDLDASHGEHVAVVGNSLMLEGVDVPLLDARVGAKVEPAPYFVLAAEYYDWYFGLKRLFAEGVRPRYVLLGLSPNQLASPHTRGDYSARYLFQASDLPTIVRQTHMDATTASEFLLSHFSEYYSTREIMRGFVMGRVLPGVGELLHARLGTVRAPAIEDSTLKQLAAERLQALDQLCKANGSRFMLVIPPSYQEGAETIAQVGKEVGVTVLVPVEYSELDATEYNPDGFHLNEKGARIFTTRLAAALVEHLPK
jgi:hypothetical protein